MQQRQQASRGGACPGTLVLHDSEQLSRGLAERAACDNPPPAASYGANACPLPPACPMPSEIEAQM